MLLSLRFTIMWGEFVRDFLLLVPLHLGLQGPCIGITESDRHIHVQCKTFCQIQTRYKIKSMTWRAACIDKIALCNPQPSTHTPLLSKFHQDWENWEKWPIAHQLYMCRLSWSLDLFSLHNGECRSCLHLESHFAWGLPSLFCMIRVCATVQLWPACDTGEQWVRWE